VIITAVVAAFALAGTLFTVHTQNKASSLEQSRRELF